VTRSGKSGFHGSFFEFLRNSALDARNYFDHPSIAEPAEFSIRRNEFGFYEWRPVVLPHLYDGETARSICAVSGIQAGAGNDQVLAVPTAAERGSGHREVPGRQHGHAAGTVNPAIAAVLAAIHSPTTQPARMVREPMLRLQT